MGGLAGRLREWAATWEEALMWDMGPGLGVYIVWGVGQCGNGPSLVQGFAESLQQSLKTKDPRPFLIWKK